MTYTIEYSGVQMVDGVKESSCKALDGVKEIHRFSVRGYADEAGRDEAAKGILSAWIAKTGYGESVETHPVMKASLSVEDKDLPKALEIV